MVKGDDWIGRFVICRCHNAGVHAGILVARNGSECELKDSRRLWRWRVKNNAGISLSDIATVGLDKKDTRLGAPVSIVLTECCEYINCTPEAAENISKFPTYAP